ncbi:MAG: MATE family efflux transporter [Nocardioidaceae bacterium]
MSASAGGDVLGTEATPRPALRRLARGVTANLIGVAVTAVATFGITIAVTRSLVPSDAGIFFATTSLFLLANAIGQLGTQTGLVYFLPRARAQGRRQLISTYLRVALRPVIAVAVALAAVMLITAPQLAELISSDHAETTAAYLRVLALFIPFAAFEMVVLAATRGFGTMRPYASIELIGRPIFQLALVAVVAFAGSNVAMGAAWGLPYLPAAALAWFWWRRLLGEIDRPPDADQPAVSVTGDFWRFSAPRAFTSVAQIVMQRFDIVLVAALAGAVEAAIYAAATRFVVVGQFGNNAISLAAQPRLAEALAHDNRADAGQIYRVATAWLMTLTWPLYLTMLIFGSVLLRVFGDGYSTGSGVLVLLALAMLFSTACGMVEMVLSMAGKTLWNMLNMIVALAVQLAIDIWLIPEHGVMGAAIGWSAAIVVRNVAALIQVMLALGLHPLGRVTAMAGGLVVVTCFLSLGLARLVLHTSVLGLVAGLVASGVLYSIGLWRLRVPLRLGALVAVRRRGRESTEPSPS